ncbi:hypothetical protein K2173_018663 [Erythroxylum novogranatense]|uniref:Uncharacterized protein n=1 Tax=Erythroxylum novogranatense TaxID=1862640 RepID=A0AAV8SAZ2_9ROSI|nr:hypothetical protein K2173_018663 [Erythroxylum novogranatense]
MVRFSCFNSHIQTDKAKKSIGPSVEAMSKTLEDSSQIASKMLTTKFTSLNSLFLNTKTDPVVSDCVKDATSSVALGPKLKSEEVKGGRIRLIKKSRSLGSGLCHEGRILCENDTEDEIEQEFSSDSLDQNGLLGVSGSKEEGVTPTSLDEKALQSETVQVSSDLVNEESIFSIEDPHHYEKGSPEIFEILSHEDGNASCNHTPQAPLMIVKSYSMPEIAPTPTSHGFSNKFATHSRSSEDLRVLDLRRKDVSICEVVKPTIQEHGADGNLDRMDGNTCQILLDEGCDSYSYSALAKDWIVPVMDELTSTKSIQDDSTQQWDEVRDSNFKLKRINEWVNDLQHCEPLEEKIDLPDANELRKRNSTTLNNLIAAKVDSVVTLEMEAAKRYISSLSPSATMAQLSNHGLAVIPFLGAFVSLKVLILSGNSIGRITTGALPRGLHVLNLSKNNISTIEGLRDLTRLRVLDLSYNRILRIGHGLASCSSLKELYLAGNKISEVEGLHRLLKLTVLDLRFNKVSTAKCLGQLAANYNSLQAISLEGNPAQKNVGDEQIKKYLQGLLPHLVYFNRQSIKPNGFKDAADRSVRLAVSSHHFDRGLRSDNKAVKKASHGHSSSRLSSLSTNGRKSQAIASPKRSRGRHARLPPAVTKTTEHHHHAIDFGSKIFNIRAQHAMRRSQSEGTLEAL